MNKKNQQLLLEIKEAAKTNSLEKLLSASKTGTDESRIINGFAACVHAIRDGVGLDPYDEQIAAALALIEGKVAEMATGEGKTVSAVFAAFYNALNGRPTHVMTFNDYLAKRDYKWMKPAYDLLGISCAYITEKTPREQRKEAYKAEVLYISAKECCFDFLRDFVTQTPDETVMDELCAAIVDEADSILIDEARIPLVVAGEVEARADEDLPEIMAFVKDFTQDDYEISLENNNAYLTDEGAAKAEAHYGLDNLYDDENRDLLLKINDSLKAWFLLTENKDYIVKDNSIGLIDRFTGRVAQNRHYPGTLQSAVEVKHGVTVTSRGMIMGMIPLQFFMRQYKHLCGMTGTAQSAEDEFDQLYDLQLEIIPPHTPSKRVDNQPELYYDSAAKWNAVCKAISEAHRKGQPVLIGTADIETGEMLAEMLKKNGIEDFQLLTAKNDEMEAEIISNAGAPGKITISTNMAGRGVDIKLGGADEAEKETVTQAGGLLVIGTYLAESNRINKQLMGRSGRQGDVGESRLFVSLDEEIMSKYKLKSLVPQKHYPAKTAERLDDKILAREVARIQRISEGDTLDERKRLLKFTMIGEKHREQIFSSRKRFLLGDSPKMWQEDCPEMYDEAVAKYGADKVAGLERSTVIAKINDFWCEYLEYTAALREGVHLSVIGGKNPADEYNISAENYYSEMEDRLRDAMAESLERLLETGADNYRVSTPANICTYLLEDSGDELNKQPLLVGWLGEPQEYEDKEEASAESEKEKDRGGKEKKGFFGRLFGK